MHADILESARFPEIVFKPASVKNAAFLTPRHQGLSEAEVSGTVRLLGQDHDAVLNISVQPQGDGQMKISTRLSVPYVKWGLKNPSTFVLRVSDTVEVDVQAVVRVKTRKDEAGKADSRGACSLPQAETFTEPDREIQELVVGGRGGSVAGGGSSSMPLRRQSLSRSLV